MLSVDKNLHILEATGRLTPFVPVIRRATEEAMQTISIKLELPPFDVVVADAPSLTIPELGTGAWAYKSHVFISIDPKFPNLIDELEIQLKRTDAHESHHVTRMNGPVGYGETLLEAIVSEGLSDHFDAELWGFDPYPWSVALRDEELEAMRSLAELEYHNRNYVHDHWFYGSEERGIPRWSGYALGFKLVGAYLQKTGQTASELVHAPAGDFIS